MEKQKITEVEAFLMRPQASADDSIKSNALLWSVGLLIIIGNLIFNPYWEGLWWQKIWLPAVYIGALGLLLVSKFNRKSEMGRIVFEAYYIRVIPRGDQERQVFRIAELEELTLDLGQAGFLRNPFNPKLGIISFVHGGQNHEFQFRLRNQSDLNDLGNMANGNW